MLTPDSAKHFLQAHLHRTPCWGAVCRASLRRFTVACSHAQYPLATAALEQEHAAALSTGWHMPMHEAAVQHSGYSMFASIMRYCAARCCLARSERLRAKSEQIRWAALAAMRAGDEAGARRLLEVRSALACDFALCGSQHAGQDREFAVPQSSGTVSAQAKAKVLECASASSRRASLNLALAVKLEEALQCMSM